MAKLNFKFVKSLLSTKSKISAKRAIFLAPVLTAVAILVVVLLLVSNDNSHTGHTKISSEEYQRQLQAEVDTEDGAPRSGRDPASQPQNSLESAASKPSGAGQRIDKPASDITDEDHSHHSSDDSDVNNDSSDTGVGVNGCYIDYGIQGEQCLQVHASGDDGVLTCVEVKKYFPNGIKVSGKDRFNLDANNDKLACGAGD